MNKLIELETWRQNRFEEPKPSIRSCQLWAQNGDIPAIKRGRKWYIDLTREAASTGNQLIDQFMEA